MGGRMRPGAGAVQYPVGAYRGPACLGLGAELALSSPQLACTPPLQLGTRLLRVALEPTTNG